MDCPEYELYYHCTNNGDGSVSVELHQTESEAEKADEEMDEGWGEPCNGSIRLKIISGVLHYQTYDDKYNTVWKEVERVG